MILHSEFATPAKHPSLCDAVLVLTRFTQLLSMANCGAVNFQAETLACAPQIRLRLVVESVPFYSGTLVGGVFIFHQSARHFHTKNWLWQTFVHCRYRQAA